MSYYTKEDRERNREIFDRFLKYKVRYRVGNPPEHQTPQDVPRMPIITTTGYKSVDRMKKLGIFDREGNITPLGVEVSKVEWYVLENKDVSHVELEEQFNPKAIEVAAKAGLIDKFTEPHYQPRLEERPSLWDLPLSEVFPYLSEDAFMGRLMTSDGRIIIPKIIFVKDKRSRTWYRKRGPYFTLEKVKEDKDKCGLAILIYEMLSSWGMDKRIGSVIQDYDKPSTPGRYPPIFYELKEKARALG